VSTFDLKRTLLKQGVPSYRVHVSGIPIRNTFEDDIHPSILFKKYQIDPIKKVVLIMAGAHGVLKNTTELCQQLLMNHSVQVIVVCGNNKLLKNELHKIEPMYKKRLHVFGYVERVDELYRISSCMVTKPGGITLSEAAALSLPVVLYKPVPGQEKENALYFQKKGAAIIVTRPEDVVVEVKRLLKNEQKLLSMREHIGQIHLKNSAQVIIEDILNERKTDANRKLIVH
jgi:processive 1,2-diacylglycerol beta-glucosyltransferase